MILMDSKEDSIDSAQFQLTSQRRDHSGSLGRSNKTRSPRGDVLIPEAMTRITLNIPSALRICGQIFKFQHLIALSSTKEQRYSTSQKHVEQPAKKRNDTELVKIFREVADVGAIFTPGLKDSGLTTYHLGIPMVLYFWKQLWKQLKQPNIFFIFGMFDSLPERAFL